MNVRPQRSWKRKQ